MKTTKSIVLDLMKIFGPIIHVWPIVIGLNQGGDHWG